MTTKQSFSQACETLLDDKFDMNDIKALVFLGLLLCVVVFAFCFLRKAVKFLSFQVFITTIIFVVLTRVPLIRSVLISWLDDPNAEQVCVK